MQQKQGMFTVKNSIFLVVIVGIAGLGALAMVNIPAPQKPIEKELDAKAFIEQKQ